ncbi:unnamed protein product, partial [Polarella glacialis]
VASSYAIAFVVYAAFAVAAFRRFQSGVEGNVLRNYDPTNSVLIAWMGMGFSIAFTYPMVFTASREACVNLMNPVKQKIMSSPRLQDLMASPRFGSRLGRAGRSMSLMNVLGPGNATRKLSSCENSAITFTIVLMTGVVASFCTDVGLVNALAGSIMGCSIAYIFPALLFFHTVLAQLRGPAERRGLDQPLLSSGDDKPLQELPKDPNIRFLMKCSLVV